MLANMVAHSHFDFYQAHPPPPPLPPPAPSSARTYERGQPSPSRPSVGFRQDGPETVRLLGGKKIMLQKWHGMFVAGESLGECFYLALSIDRACHAQRALLQTGRPYHSPTGEEVARWSRAYGEIAAEIQRD